MPPEPQNPIPEEISVPPSPQEPIPEVPIPPSTSEPVDASPVAPESPAEAESTVPVNIDNPEISSVEPEIPAPEQTAQIEEVGENKPISEAPQISTAQMGRSESFDLAHDKPLGREVLVKAREVIQNKKRKKLDSILTLLTKQTKITNDEVEKFLHVSDATATRYLEQLEKDGKIKQSGRTGQSVSYSKI